MRRYFEESVLFILLLAVVPNLGAQESSGASSFFLVPDIGSSTIQNNIPNSSRYCQYVNDWIQSKGKLTLEMLDRVVQSQLSAGNPESREFSFPIVTDPRALNNEEKAAFIRLRYCLVFTQGKYFQEPVLNWFFSMELLPSKNKLAQWKSGPNSALGLDSLKNGRSRYPIEDFIAYQLKSKIDSRALANRLRNDLKIKPALIIESWNVSSRKKAEKKKKQWASILGKGREGKILPLPVVGEINDNLILSSSDIWIILSKEKRNFVLDLSHAVFGKDNSSDSRQSLLNSLRKITAHHGGFCRIIVPGMSKDDLEQMVTVRIGNGNRELPSNAHPLSLRVKSVFRDLPQQEGQPQAGMLSIKLAYPGNGELGGRLWQYWLHFDGLRSEFNRIYNQNHAKADAVSRVFVDFGKVASR